MKNIEKYIMVILIFVAVGAIGAAVYFGINVDKDSSKKEEDKQEEVVGTDKEGNKVEIQNLVVDGEKIEISILKDGDYIESINFNNKKIEFKEDLYSNEIIFAELSGHVALLYDGPSWIERLELYDLNGTKIDTYECFPENKDESSVIKIIDGNIMIKKVYQPFENPVAQFAEYLQNWNDICDNKYNYAIVNYKLTYANGDFVLTKNDVDCSYIEQ